MDFHRTDGNKPFATDQEKPDGAGFYSEGLSYKELKVGRRRRMDGDREGEGKG
jgi:hypothetical protein